MTVPYAKPQDVYDLGLTAQAFVVRPRALDGKAGDSLVPSTGIFSLTAHGLTSADLVRIVLIASGGAVPGGATAGQVCYPLPLDYFRFQLAATPGGTPLTFSDAGGAVPGGTSAWGIQVDPERRLSRIILNVSADIEQDLTAHSASLPIVVDPVTGLYPDKLVGVVARCAARRAITGLQFENAAFRASAERVLAEEKRDDEQRAAWRLGQPIYPAPQTQDNKPDDAARGANRFRGPLGQVGGCDRPNHWQRGAL